MRIIFFGTPEFAVPSLKTLFNSSYTLLAVVTQPDRQSGRGRHLKSCPVKLEAQKKGLKILQPQRVKEVNFIKELKALNPDLIVVVAYGQILPLEIIRLPEYGCVNIHASLLPKYRGAAPINWAIINGEKKTGVTTMLMDEGVDTGHVLLQAELNIKTEDTAESLSERLSKIGADLLIPTLHGLESGKIKPTPQIGEASYAPMLKKADGFIKWARSVREICNFIRGMNPWPGAYGFINGERFKILKAMPIVSTRDGIDRVIDKKKDAGLISKVTKDEMRVITGDGELSILEIQPSGKPTMSIKAFLQGRKLKEGMKFDLNNV